MGLPFKKPKMRAQAGHRRPKNCCGYTCKNVGEMSKNYKESWTSYKNLYAKLALKYPQKIEIVKQVPLFWKDFSGELRRIIFIVSHNSAG